MSPLLIPAVMITLMFFLSGFDKIKHFDKSTHKFSNKLSLPLTLAKVAISGVIGLEILAPLVIVGYNFGGLAMLAPYYPIALIGLMLFTVLVSVLYHNPMKNKEKYYAFMSNISTLGGLLALYMYK